MEKAGLAEKGFDATLEAMDKGKMVKQLLQSTDNTDFTWGMMALQNLLFDGGHTNVTTFPSAPNVVKEEFEKKMLAASAKFVDVSQNPGGSTDIVVATASILRKNRTGQLWSQNVLEGKTRSTRCWWTPISMAYSMKI